MAKICSGAFRLVPTAELVPYVNNARIHGEAQILQLRASMREFGFLSPIVIDEENNILAGHGRLMAARAEGMAAVPCVIAEDLTPAQRKAYILADNRLAETATWDKALLDMELRGLQDMSFDCTLTGFDMSFSLPEEPEPAVEDEDDGTVPESCPHHPGDVFRLGRHTLICGDCTQPKITSKFQRGGGTVNLLLTDPPYGISYVGKTADAMEVLNDGPDEAALGALISGALTIADGLMAPGAAFYIWHSSGKAPLFFSACAAAQWPVREVLVWNKHKFVLGRQDYQWKHESCLYGWKPGAAHLWNGGRAQTTVLDFDKPNASRDHPTMKPIALFDRLIRNSSNVGDIVYDPFGGSGTTLLACEQNGRSCLMCEMDPRYVAVIIRRWEALTGQKAEKIG